MAIPLRWLERIKVDELAASCWYREDQFSMSRSIPLENERLGYGTQGNALYELPPLLMNAENTFRRDFFRWSR